jgi:1,4-dihydroxy-2-naphthoate polyprenyltransferase
MKQVEKQSKFESWILASRPKTLLAAFVPVMVGSSIALNEKKFVLVYACIALICSVLIQTGTNFVNDLYDFISGADNEKRKGPKRVLASGLISAEEMRIGIFLVFGLAFLLGLYLVYARGILVLIIGVASILAAIAYTTGPFPLAYKGLGDVFVFMFFGVVGTVGTFYVHTKEISLLSFLVSIPVGSLITNILVVNNLRDIEEDKAAGKNTLAVRMGKTFTKYQFLFLILISFFIPAILFFFYNYSAIIFLPYLTIPIAYKITYMLFTTDGQSLNKTLEMTAKLSALFGLLFSVALAI